MSNELPEIDSNDFDPIGQDDTTAILAGLDQINEKVEAKKGKKGTKAEEAQAEEEYKSKYSQEELLKIYDALVFEGTYRETFKGRKIALTLRSRTGDDAISINRAMDRFEGKTYMTVTTYSNMLTLAHSLVAFTGKDFKDKDIKGKYEFLLTLPDPIIAILFDKLQEFDMKVGDAIREGRKNF